jgi:hypothetical protein
MINLNKEFLNYFSKEFCKEEFTIEDIKNNKYLSKIIEKDNLKKELEEKSYYLRQMNANNTGKKEIEKEIKVLKEKYKELTGKNWKSTKYILNNPIEVDYSELTGKETYYQKNFEQGIDILIIMMNIIGPSIPFTTESMSKSKKFYHQLHKQNNET